MNLVSGRLQHTTAGGLLWSVENCSLFAPEPCSFAGPDEFDRAAAHFVAPLARLNSFRILKLCRSGGRRLGCQKEAIKLQEWTTCLTPNGHVEWLQHFKLPSATTATQPFLVKPLELKGIFRKLVCAGRVEVCHPFDDSRRRVALCCVSDRPKIWPAQISKMNMLYLHLVGCMPLLVQRNVLKPSRWLDTDNPGTD